MASTPSSTSTRHGRRRRMNEAWQQTTHNTRKIQLKLKHSLSNLSSREIPFEQEPGRRSRRGYVSNIDQALGAFGKHRLQDLDVVEEPGEDWILDGHDEWQQQYQRSNELLAQWQGSSFTEAEWLWKLGSIGNQEYQFAQFDSESCVNNLNNETDEDEDEDEDMSSFGDFQEASKEQGEDARTEPNPQGVLTQDIQEHAIPPWENVDINLPPTRPTSTSFTCMERTPDHAADAGAPFPQTMQRTPLEQPPLALEAAPGTLQIPRTPLNQPFDSAVALATNAPSLPNKIDRTPLGNMERNPLPETSSTRFTHANIDRRKDSLSPVGILNKQAMAERSYPTRVNMDIRPLPEQIEATNTCSTPAPSEPAPAPAPAPAGILHQIEWTTPLPNTTMEEKKEAATVDSFVTTPILSEPTSPANKNQNINKELDSVMDKLEHSYSYSTPEHSKPEPKTPTATNVSKQQQQKQKQKKYHLGDAFARMEGNSLQDNESGKEEEEENWTSSSCRSSSIPSVVQLFTDATPQRNVVVPTSVKWSSPQTSISLLGSSPFTRRPLPRRSLQLEDPEFRSIASDSLASPEGRFLRRHLSDRFADQEDDNENDQDSIQGSSGSLSLEQRLPPNDNTVQVLQSLEWEWFPYGGDDTLLQANNQNVTLLQEQITNTLSELDSTHNRCCKLLHKRIQPHSKKLLTANVAALDLAQNLTICQIYWQRSHESIQLAKHGAGDEQNGGGGGVVGAKNLLSWWDTQESYQKMQNLVEEMAQVFQIEEQLIQRIEEYDSRPEDSLEECQAILEGCRSLEERLKSDPLIRLTCLNQFRTRVSQLVSGNFVTRLHTWLESTTIRCCHFQHFRSVEYSRLVQAVLLLGKNSDSHPLVSSICTTIQTALLVETQKAFGMALLDPTDSEDMEDSEYEKELLALSQQSMYLELSRIPIWLHNLVTIRLDFEIQKHPLPAVYHKLCCLLTNVLYGQFRLLEWHKEEAESPSITDEVLTLIYTELLDRRASIWNSCIKVLEECLEEYLKFVGKKKLFEWRDNVHVDSEWWIDLKGLEDVLQLTDQFMSLSAEFLEGVEQKIINDGSMLREKMYTILKKHLRSSHVEAMNTMGLILYKEDWTLVPFKASSPYSIGDTPPPTSTRELVQSTLNALLIDERSSQKSINRSRRNHFSFGTANCHLANFKELGNPFHQISNPEEINGDDTNHTPISTQAAEKNKAVDEIYNLLESFCGSNNPTVFNVVPQCLLEGVLKWVSRLLMIMQKLPPVTEDACKVFRNIFDLYTTTCFRVCSGSSKHESILLGVKAPKTNIKVDQPSRAQGASSPLFGFRRRSSSSIPKMSRVALTLSAYAEAELCAPLPCEMESLACLRDLILTAQANLQGIAKLDLVNGWIVDPVSTPFESQTDAADKIARTLEKRLAASWSCLFLAAVLRVASVKAKKNLKTSVSSLDSLESYVDSFMKAAPVLVSLSNRISCIRSIDGKGVLQEIIKVGSGWEEAKLHEHPNNYVDVLCDLIALVWASLSKAGKLPNGALKLIWGEMLAGGYMTLLDGFSRVPFCSTEGRALMSMDLASYSSGTSPRSVDKRLEDHDAAVSLPPTVTILRGMSYVDTYIKVFYFPPKDAIGWIEENHEAYLRNHLISLIVGAATSSDEDDSLSVPKLVDSVKKLYRHYSAPDGYYDEDATSSSGRLVKV